MDLPRLTPSSVTDLDCPKRFHTLRVLHQWPPRPHTTVNIGTEFGIALHAVLRHVFDPRHAPLPKLDHLDAWTRSAFFARNYPDTELREKEIARCIEVARTYALNDDDAPFTIDVERQGEFPIAVNGTPLFLLSAKLDRVLVRPNEKVLTIRDYKTSRRYRNLEEAFFMLWAAKLLYPNYKSFALELDWIDEQGDVKREVIHGKDLRGMHKPLIEKAVRLFTLLAEGEHHAEPGEACFGCLLRKECQPQIEVPLDTEHDIFEED